MSLGRSYARALLEAAVEAGMKSADLDKIESELAGFVQTVGGSPDLHAAFSNPVIPSDDKGDVAAAVAAKLGLSKLTTNFLTLIIQKGRAPHLEAITEAFTSIRLESEGATLGTVVSADPMQQKDLEELATSFTRKLGKKVVFKASVDTNLLAGLKVTVNGTTYDGSLRAQLQQLRDRLVYSKSGTAH